MGGDGGGSALKDIMSGTVAGFAQVAVGKTRCNVFLPQCLLVGWTAKRFWSKGCSISSPFQLTTMIFELVFYMRACLGICIRSMRGSCGPAVTHVLDNV